MNSFIDKMHRQAKEANVLTAFVIDNGTFSLTARCRDTGEMLFGIVSPSELDVFEEFEAWTTERKKQNGFIQSQA